MHQNPHNPSGARFVRTKELARITNISVAFWNKARIAGGGPPFAKVGTAVLYDLEQVGAWLKSQTFQTTDNRS